MTGLFNARTAEEPGRQTYFSGKEPGTTKVGEKLFSDAFTLKSDIGNPILRQTPIGTDGLAARAGDVDREGRAQERSPTTRRTPSAQKKPDAGQRQPSLVMEGRT